jgi:hypothetical protein
MELSANCTREVMLFTTSPEFVLNEWVYREGTIKIPEPKEVNQ